MKSIIALMGIFAATASAQFNTYQGYPYQIRQSQDLYPFGQLPLPVVGQYPRPVVSQDPQFINGPWYYGPFGRTYELEHIPAYTTLAKDWDQFYEDIEQHINLAYSLVSGGQTDSNFYALQYIMILNAVNHLIDEMVKNRSLYDEFYDPTIKHTIQSVKSNPSAAVVNIRTKLDSTGSKIQNIRQLISQKQKTCREPMSIECDMIIDRAVHLSDSSRVKEEASLLSALKFAMEWYLGNYSNEFNKVATTGGAENYLKNNSGRLRPLIIAGYEERVKSNAMPVSGQYDPRSGVYLGQRISCAIQRGNAASALGNLPGSDLLSKQ